VATALEAATRTAEVRVIVPNPDGALLPGMFLQVEIESSAGASGPVLAVPDAAVLTIEGRPAVFLPGRTWCERVLQARGRGRCTGRRPLPDPRGLAARERWWWSAGRSA
jgi:hypothetical protein